MRALILGGSGAIGSAVARHAASIGIETHVGIRESSSLDRIAPFPAIRRHVFEATDPGTVGRLVDEIRPDWIVMAAFPGDPHATSTLARRRILQGMIGGLLGVMEAVENAVFSGSLTWIGSALSYGGGRTLCRGRDALRPRTFRGAVKAAESILSAQIAATVGIPLTEIRVFSGYGPFEPRGRLIPSLLRAGLSGERVSLSLVPARRDWIHYEDIAAACVADAVHPVSGQRVFNACSGRVHDTHEVARMLEQITGMQLVGEEPFEGADHYGDALPGELPSATDGFEWSPRIELQQGLEQSWRWASSAQGRSYLLAGGRPQA